MVADHLSRLVLETSYDGLPIGDTFPDEQLFALVHYPWYADIMNFSVTGQNPSRWTSQQKRKFMVHVKMCYFDDPYLFKYCPDKLIRCVTNDDQIRVLTFYHSVACGGHFLQGKQLIRYCKLVFISPRFLKIVLNTAKLVLGANN